MTQAIIKNKTDIRLFVGDVAIAPHGEVQIDRWEFKESGDDVKSLVKAKAIEVKVLKAKEEPKEEDTAEKSTKK